MPKRILGPTFSQLEQTEAEWVTNYLRAQSLLWERTDYTDKELRGDGFWSWEEGSPSVAFVASRKDATYVLALVHRVSSGGSDWYDTHYYYYRLFILPPDENELTFVFKEDYDGPVQHDYAPARLLRQFFGEVKVSVESREAGKKYLEEHRKAQVGDKKRQGWLRGLSPESE